MRKVFTTVSLALVICAAAMKVFGAETAPAAAVTPDALEAFRKSMQVGVDTAWVLFTAFLVFFMNLGFAMVESGLCRAKNSVNILAKNFIVFAIASLSFWFVGWGLMFGNGNPFMGLEGVFFAGGADNSPATGDAYKGAYAALNWTGVPLWAKFFFQLVFAGTAATIVSGAVAERVSSNRSSSFHSSWWRSCIPLPATGSGAAAGCRAWACLTSPAPPWSTPWAAGRPWPGSYYSGRASGNTAPTDR